MFNNLFKILNYVYHKTHSWNKTNYHKRKEKNKRKKINNYISKSFVHYFNVKL